MSEKFPKDSDFRSSCEVVFMTAVAEASSLLKTIAEPRPIGDTVKAAIRRAAKQAGLTFGRAEDIWRQEARAIRAEEMDAIRRAAARPDVEEARAEYQTTQSMLARIAALEAALRVRDQDFHSQEIAALGELSGRVGRPVDRGDD